MLKKEDIAVIKALAENGVYQKDIAEQLSVHPKTVSRALKRGRAPDKPRPAQPSKLEPYQAEIDRLLSAQAAGGPAGDYGPESYTYDPTTGSLASKAGVSCTYGDAQHKHAVTALSNGDSFSYDPNGSMITRNIGGRTFNLSCNAENRMTGVIGAATANFVYDDTGARVIATEGVTTTVYVGSYFEWHGSISDTVKYYYAGTVRVAMR